MPRVETSDLAKGRENFSRAFNWLRELNGWREKNSIYSMITQ